MKLTLYLAFLLTLSSLQFACADTLTLTIIEQNDDAEEAITGPMAGNVQRSSTDLEIGNENGVEQWVGLRFQNAAIPPGATINSATIQFTSEDTDVGNLIVPIFGELSLAPEPFRDATPLTGRTLTTQFVDWDIQPWFDGDRNERTTTPNLAQIVQALIDQDGWQSGGSIAFIIKNQPMDTSERLAVSFDGNAAEAATITIDFTAPIPIETLTVVKGETIAGSASELNASDNSDLIIRRSPSEISGAIEVEVEATSNIASPSQFTFTLESSALFRSPVIQSISFFDFNANQMVEVDSRNARRLVDSVVVAQGTGDLTRFVEPGTGLVRARILYAPVVRRQSYSASIDHVYYQIQ